MKKYLSIFILCAISFICGVAINSSYADSPKTTNIENVNGVSYEFIYVNGEKYVIFKYGNDIEVVKY